MLDGYKPVAANMSSWNKDTDYARYTFQPAEGQTIEVAGRFTMRHFAAADASQQSTAKVVDSYQALFAALGGVKLFDGLFTGGRIDTLARSEQQSREGAT